MRWLAIVVSATALTGGYSDAAEPSGTSGLAPSIDPSWTWVETPPGHPVIDRGPEGGWDHLAVDNPFVLVDGDRYLCFYEAQDKPFDRGGREQIGLAVSSDGVHWEKKSAGNPIFGVGPEGAWDSHIAKLPTVFERQGTYYLFYSGKDARTKQIGLATSTDLISWTKHEANPVLRARPGKWDRQLSTHPASVFRREGRFYLLYRGMSRFYADQGLGLAVSDDLVHWERARDDPVIPTDREIASLAVVETPDGYLAIAQSPGRPYWRSADLVTWTEGPSAKFTGPRVETLSNPFLAAGGWRVLYEQQDRIYAAVLSEPRR
jgi:hypothetical protein